ncbi:MAG: hypothetical protein DHS20C17_26220 [Cyclobacteriaceae bacterium]|nr:MAG: hypothetical protein DHS20C17_26220 [Cyclobacteriaceae bacterium]
MCTVTFIPKGNNQFLLATSRDESPGRWTDKLTQQRYGESLVVFPVDPVSGGSWIAASNQQQVGCILNGAFDHHSHNPPYARSRGLILLDYFQLGNIVNFNDRVNLNGIEPFTLVAIEKNQLFDFRWDGHKKYLKNLSFKSAHFWNSATLYDQEATIRRKTWFTHWLKTQPDPEIQDLINFHQYGGPMDTHNGLVINRNNRVQTLSITGIEKQEAVTFLHYHDLIKDNAKKFPVDIPCNEIMGSI